MIPKGVIGGALYIVLPQIYHKNIFFLLNICLDKFFHVRLYFYYQTIFLKISNHSFNITFG